MPLYPGPSAGFSNSAFQATTSGLLLGSTAGISRPLKLCTIGSSHMTATFGFGDCLQYALMRYHDANIISDFRGVFTSVSNATIIANRGWWYATPTAGRSHIASTQLPQFVTDTTSGGYAYDIVVTDFGIYNDAPSTQANLDSAFSDATTLTLPTIFAQGVTAVIVWGLFGTTPALCQSWANMWTRYAETDKRIRFVDVARVVSDPLNAGTTWDTSGTGWRGGKAVLGAATHDGTHLSNQGARFAALPLSNVLRVLSPATFYQAASYAVAAYDPVSFRWGDLLGPARAMLGTGGFDGAGGGTADTTVPTGWWKDSTPQTLTRSSSITTYTATNANEVSGQRQFNYAMTNTYAANNTMEFQSFVTGITNVNNSDATRRYMYGAEIELVGVTGLANIFLDQGNTNFGNSTTYRSPVSNSAGLAADGLPNTTSEIYRMRSLFPIPLTGNNPMLKFFFNMRASTGAGNIIIRNAWAKEVL